VPAPAPAPAPTPPTPPAPTGSLGYPRDFATAYDMHDELIGAGASGRVHGATHRATGRRVAVKVLPKRRAAPAPGVTRGGGGGGGGPPSPPVAAAPFSSSSGVAGPHAPAPLPPPSTCRAAAIRREVGATALAGAGSPHAPRLLGVYESDNEAFLVLERCEGGDLRALLAARGGAPLPEAAAAGVLRGVLHALAAGHARGLVYADVKPANVCLLRRRACVDREVRERGAAASSISSGGGDDSDGGGGGGGAPSASSSSAPSPSRLAAECERVFFGGVRLVDWGAASAPSRRLAGSPLYWAPEQALGYMVPAWPAGGAGGRAGAGHGHGDDGDGGDDGGGGGGVTKGGYGPAIDIWAAGVLAYQMMSGRFPFWPKAAVLERTAEENGSSSGGGGSDGGEGAPSEGVPRGLRPDQLLAAIRTAPIGPWPGASREARDLVVRLMLARDPCRRPTADECLAHPFFGGERHAGGGF